MQKIYYKENWKKMGTKFYLKNLLVSIHFVVTIHFAICMNDTTYKIATKDEVNKNSNINVLTGKKIS